MITLALDPGHGGIDPGAIWPRFISAPQPRLDPAQSKTAIEDWREREHQRFLAHLQTCTHIESRLTLAMADYLGQRLAHSCEPIHVAMLRGREDEHIPLHVRGALSAAAAAGMVLSIHFNSGAPTQRGAECFYWPDNKRVCAVGDAILDAMPPPLRRMGRRSYAATDTPDPQDDWLRRARAVLSPHRCDTLLVEIAYLSYEEDRQAIDDPATQAAIVTALEVGVSRYRQIIESPQIAGVGG